MSFATTVKRTGLRRRAYTQPATPPKSGHAQWYSDVVPAMVPIFLLGSAVYLGLQLTQLKLSHEKFMQDATERVRALETEIAALQEKRVVEDNHQPDTTSPPGIPAKKTFRWWW